MSEQTGPDRTDGTLPWLALVLGLVLVAGLIATRLTVAPAPETYLPPTGAVLFPRRQPGAEPAAVRVPGRAAGCEGDRRHGRGAGRRQAAAPEECRAVRHWPADAHVRTDGDRRHLVHPDVHGSSRLGRGVLPRTDPAHRPLRSAGGDGPGGGRVRRDEPRRVHEAAHGGPHQGDGTQGGDVGRGAGDGGPDPRPQGLERGDR